LTDSFKPRPLPAAYGQLAMSETELRKLPNIGPAMARTLVRLGIQDPADLAGKDPLALYERLQVLDGRPADPCVLDTFTAVVDHANGAPARPWWMYSRERLSLRGG
jgi:Pathogenicity locus